MEPILEAFGINWRLIVIQMFNFALLAGLLWYFLYTPLLNMLKERQEKIERGVRDAENAAKVLESAGDEKQEILSIAHKEAEAISARAKESAEEKTAEAIEEARARADALLKDAEDKSESMKQEAVRASESEIAKLAVLAAEKVIRQK